MTAKDSYTVTVVATDPKGIPTDDATAAAANADAEVQRHRHGGRSASLPVDEPPIFTVTSDVHGIQQCR